VFINKQSCYLNAAYFKENLGFLGWLPGCSHIFLQKNAGDGTASVTDLPASRPVSSLQ
jgi:hypothetical protein